MCYGRRRHERATRLGRTIRGDLSELSEPRSGAIIAGFVGPPGTRQRYEMTFVPSFTFG